MAIVSVPPARVASPPIVWKASAVPALLMPRNWLEVPVMAAMLAVAEPVTPSTESPAPCARIEYGTVLLPVTVPVSARFAIEGAEASTAAPVPVTAVIWVPLIRNTLPEPAVS